MIVDTKANLNKCDHALGQLQHELQNAAHQADAHRHDISNLNSLLASAHDVKDE